MNIGLRIAQRREELKLTRQALAEATGVSEETVSSWELGEALPQADKLVQLAQMLRTTTAWLLEEGDQRLSARWELHDKMFSSDNMYRFVKVTAHAKQMMQTLKALRIMKEQHAGQTRKGKDHLPYIVHPLMMACHAFAMGIDNDELIATILLHDVVEDCEAEADDLDVDEKVREAVALVSFSVGEGMTKDEAKQLYYEKIRYNKTAAMVKLLDRCNNVSTMAVGFSREQIASYIDETEKLVMPLLDYVKHNYDEYYNAAFLLKYQLRSVMESLKRTI